MLRRQLKRQRTTPVTSSAGAPDVTLPAATTDLASVVSSAAAATSVLPDESDEETGDWDACAELVDDTLAAIQLLTSRSADRFAALGVPPVVLWHQLYTVFPSRTFVDQNVHRLRNAGALVTFHVPSGTDEVALVPTAAYAAELEKWLRMLRSARAQQTSDASVASRHDALARLVRALPKLSKLPSIPFHVLLDALQCEPAPLAGSATGGGDSEQAAHDDIMWLQRLGFLRQLAHRLDGEVLHLSLPGVGKLVSAVTRTRTALLATLRRTKYKEAAETQLRKRRLQHAHVGWDYHFADMEGLGLVRRTKVSSGTLVALAAQP